MEEGVGVVEWAEKVPGSRVDANRYWSLLSLIFSLAVSIRPGVEYPQYVVYKIKSSKESYRLKSGNRLKAMETGV